MKNYKKQINLTLFGFCAIIIFAMCLLQKHLGNIATNLRESQEKIINKHVSHIADVDSLFFDMKAIILSTDSGTIANAPALLSQLHRDSALFRREILLSEEEMSSLTELHLNRIDSSFDQMNFWFGVVAVIFIVLSFFSMFKIEESKRDAKNVLEDVKQSREAAMEDIKEVQKQAVGVMKYLEGVKQDYDTFVNERSSKLEDLERKLSTAQYDSNQSLDLIKALLKEVETKNEQYNWSIKTMQEQMQQLKELTVLLNDIIKNKGKEDTNE